MRFYIMTTERWTDEPLDRLAEAIASTRALVDANAEAIESTRALVDANAEAIAQLIQDADADRTLILEMMRYLYDQQGNGRH